MDWRGQRESGNVEDNRGGGGIGAGHILGGGSSETKVKILYTTSRGKLKIAQGKVIGFTNNLLGNPDYLESCVCVSTNQGEKNIEVLLILKLEVEE